MKAILALFVVGLAVASAWKEADWFTHPNVQEIQAKGQKVIDYQKAEFIAAAEIGDTTEMALLTQNLLTFLQNAEDQNNKALPIIENITAVLRADQIDLFWLANERLRLLDNVSYYTLDACRIWIKEREESIRHPAIKEKYTDAKNKIEKARYALDYQARVFVANIEMIIDQLTDSSETETPQNAQKISNLVSAIETANEDSEVVSLTKEALQMVQEVIDYPKAEFKAAAEGNDTARMAQLTSKLLTLLQDAEYYVDKDLSIIEKITGALKADHSLLRSELLRLFQSVSYYTFDACVSWIGEREESITNQAIKEGYTDAKNKIAEAKEAFCDQADDFEENIKKIKKLTMSGTETAQNAQKISGLVSAIERANNESKVVSLTKEALQMVQEVIDYPKAEFKAAAERNDTARMAQLTSELLTLLQDAEYYAIKILSGYEKITGALRAKADKIDHSWSQSDLRGFDELFDNIPDVIFDGYLIWIEEREGSIQNLTTKEKYIYAKDTIVNARNALEDLARVFNANIENIGKLTNSSGTETELTDSSGTETAQKAKISDLVSAIETLLQESKVVSLTKEALEKVEALTILS